jgi:hypothetical protein
VEDAASGFKSGSRQFGCERKHWVHVMYITLPYNNLSSSMSVEHSEP